MKKTLFLMLLLPVSALAGYYLAELNQATVNQEQGLYLFIESTPAGDYEYLGTVKNTVTFGSGQFADVKKILIKKAKKEYPEANGLILHFVNGGTDYADAVILKR